MNEALRDRVTLDYEIKQNLKGLDLQSPIISNFVHESSKMTRVDNIKRIKVYVNLDVRNNKVHYFVIQTYKGIPRNSPHSPSKQIKFKLVKAILTGKLVNQAQNLSADLSDITNEEIDLEVMDDVVTLDYCKEFSPVSNEILPLSSRIFYVKNNKNPETNYVLGLDITRDRVLVLLKTAEVSIVLKI